MSTRPYVEWTRVVSRFDDHRMADCPKLAHEQVACTSYKSLSCNRSGLLMHRLYGCDGRECDALAHRVRDCSVQIPRRATRPRLSQPHPTFGIPLLAFRESFSFRASASARTLALRGTIATRSTSGRTSVSYCIVHTATVLTASTLQPSTLRCTLS